MKEEEEKTLKITNQYTNHHQKNYQKVQHV